MSGPTLGNDNQRAAGSSLLTEDAVFGYCAEYVVDGTPDSWKNYPRRTARSLLSIHAASGKEA